MIKRILCKISLAVPYTLACLLFYDPICIYIAELHLDLWYDILPYTFLIFTLFWTHISPLQESVKGSILEIVYNFMPIEILLTLITAQYNYIFAFGVILAVVVSPCLFYILLDFENKISAKRFFVMSTAVLLAFPSVMAVFVYDLEALHYDPEESIMAQINNEQSAGEKDIVRYFDDDQWSERTVEEKVAILKLFADYESEYLGIPQIRLKSSRISPHVLGLYHTENQIIYIDLVHLIESPPKKIVLSLLHEIFHAYQHYMVQHLTTLDEMQSSSYYNDPRAWRLNIDSYYDASFDIQLYASQPLEYSAREFAERESERLFERYCDE